MIHAERLLRGNTLKENRDDLFIPTIYSKTTITFITGLITGLVSKALVLFSPCYPTLIQTLNRTEDEARLAEPSPALQATRGRHHTKHWFVFS